MASVKWTDGSGADAYVLGAPGSGTGAFTDTTPQTTNPFEVENVDGVSLQLIVDFEQDQIAVIHGTDAVVASTGVWTFGNFTFTGLVGAKLLVTGAVNAGNNGTFVITAVSGHTATTATAGLVNETFGPNVTVFVIRSEAASVPAGTWKIEGSNDFAPTGIAAYGQAAQIGHFSDVTTLFNSPAAVAAVATATSQIVQPPGHCSIRHLRVTFTPSAGRGTARVARFGKSWCR